MSSEAVTSESAGYAQNFLKKGKSHDIPEDEVSKDKLDTSMGEKRNGRKATYEYFGVVQVG